MKLIRDFFVTFWGFSAMIMLASAIYGACVRDWYMFGLCTVGTVVCPLLAWGCYRSFEQ